MNFNLKLKKIRQFRGMTQKELALRLGIGEKDGHRIVQYENGSRVPKKDLVDQIAKILDVNPWTLYDTAGREYCLRCWNCFSGWMNLIRPLSICFFLRPTLTKNATITVIPPSVIMIMMNGRLILRSACGLTMEIQTIF